MESTDPNYDFLVKLRDYPELYDVHHPRYTDTDNRRRIWTIIGTQFDTSPDGAKIRYKNLRDAYVRSLKTNRTYRYHDLMASFITTKGVGPAPPKVFVGRQYAGEYDANSELIIRVRSLPELWDPNHETYKDLTKRKRVWDDVGREFKMSGAQARSKHRNLRDGYIRSLKKKSFYKYHDLLAPYVTTKLDLSFPQVSRSKAESVFDKFSIDLMKAIECRPCLYNGDTVTPETTEEIWEEIAENLNKTVRDCKNRFLTMKKAFSKCKSEGKRYMYDRYMDFLTPYMDTKSVKQEEGFDEEVVDTEVLIEEDDGEEEDDTVYASEEMDYISQDENITNTSTTWEFAATNQSEYMDDSNNPLDAAPHRSAAAGGRGEKSVISEDDPLKLFFSSMYSTVKVMQPKNVARLQKQIFDIVHEMQIKEMGDSD